MNTSDEYEMKEPWESFRDEIEKVYKADTKWVTEGSYTALTIAYSLLIVVGMLGNLLVLVTILRSAEMRTARNVFIANLAVSDLCLCVITMPLTLVEVMFQRWQWGDNPIFCHLQSPLQGIFVIISSLSISAIAIDRCIVICCSTINNWSARFCLSLLPLIWLTGGIVSSPLGIYRRLLSTGESLTATGYPFSDMVAMYTSYSGMNSSKMEVLAGLAQNVKMSNLTWMYEGVSKEDFEQVPSDSVHLLIISQVEFLLSEMKFPPGLIVSFAECNEMFPSPMLEMMYTTVVTIIQFIFPLVIVSLANAAIYSKLRDRLKTFSSLEANEKRKADVQKMRRTSWLLICMVTIFLICWLPLSIFNLMMVETREYIKENNTFFTMFASCHLFGMTSACTNPVLYGFLNENFKKEFKAMFDTISSKCRNRKTRSQGNTEVV